MKDTQSTTETPDSSSSIHRAPHLHKTPKTHPHSSTLPNPRNSRFSIRSDSKVASTKGCSNFVPPPQLQHYFSSTFHHPSSTKRIFTFQHHQFPTFISKSIKNPHRNIRKPFNILPTNQNSSHSHQNGPRRRRWWAWWAYVERSSGIEEDELVAQTWG